jgi:hypothetical protein
VAAKAINAIQKMPPRRTRANPFSRRYVVTTFAFLPVFAATRFPHGSSRYAVPHLGIHCIRSRDFREIVNISTNFAVLFVRSQSAETPTFSRPCENINMPYGKCNPCQRKKIETYRAEQRSFAFSAFAEHSPG